MLTLPTHMPAEKFHCQLSVSPLWSGNCGVRPHQQYTRSIKEASLLVRPYSYRIAMLGAATSNHSGNAVTQGHLCNLICGEPLLTR